ncbi:Fc.00g060010.m01.CDS01 [Cosmosporella sp. VM-42]
MMSEFLSSRATETVAGLNTPWRFAPRATYDPDKNQDGIISFATAENVLITDEIESFVKENVVFSSEHFLYRGSHGGGPRFPNALATHLNEYLNPHEPITADMIQCVGAATAMHDILAWGVADPGDGFLTSRPVYGRFELDFGNKSQVKVIYADTDAEGCLDADVVQKFEKALVRSNAAGVRIRAVFIVNPNNPLGKCYPKSTLISIMRFCQKHQLHLLSDEIYACSVFDSGEPNTVPFTSILSIDSRDLIDPELLHVTYGLSKDFGVAGLRLGAIITRSRPILRAVDAVMRFHNPSGASLAIGIAMLEDRKWCRAFVQSSREKLAKAYRHITQGLKEIGVDYLSGSNAGFFIWVDLSPYLPEDLNGGVNVEFALAEKLREAGVFLHPGEEHSLKPGWFRMVYTQDPRTVTEGLQRIKSVIHRGRSD